MVGATFPVMGPATFLDAVRQDPIHNSQSYKVLRTKVAGTFYCTPQAKLAASSVLP